MIRNGIVIFVEKVDFYLNQRLCIVKRMSNHVSKRRLQRIVDSLWTSKLRYGLQLWTEVRLERRSAKNSGGGNDTKSPK